MAKGGTLFLDDIDDVPLAMQVKLLRAHSEPHRGTSGRHPRDWRRRARDHGNEARPPPDGRGRQVPRRPLLPPERNGNGPAAAARPSGGHPRAGRDHFLAKFSRARGLRGARPFSAVGAALVRYTWPGNVREWRIPANARSRSAPAAPRASAAWPRASCSVRRRRTAGPVAAGVPTPISLDDRLMQLKQDLIGWALKVSAGNKSRAAALLNIKRSTLGDRIARCGLSEPAKRDATLSDRGSCQSRRRSCVLAIRTASAMWSASATHEFIDTPR